MKIPSCFRLFLSLLAICAFTRPAAAVPGELDLTFNTTGILTQAGARPATAIVLQTDGKIVVCGDDRNLQAGASELGIRRFNADGSIDTTFNGTGRAVVRLVGNNAASTAIALQSDGKIVVAGTLDHYSATTPAGNTYQPTMVAARLNADGSVDRSFGGSGYAFGLADMDAPGLAVQPDGAVLVAGKVISTVSGASSASLAIVRFMANGARDTSFGSGGVVGQTFGQYDEVSGLALMPDGRIVAGGCSHPESSSASDREPRIFWAARYLANGSPDLTFHETGFATTERSVRWISPGSLVVQPDGAVLLAATVTTTLGFFEPGERRIMEFVRFTVSGGLDPTFGYYGILAYPSTTIFNISDVVHSLALQSDGKILIGASTTNGHDDNVNTLFAVVRLNSNGTRENTFDDNSIVLTRFTGVPAGINALAVQPDGNIVAAGSSDATLTITRYLAAPDTITLPPVLAEPTAGSFAARSCRVTFILPERTNIDFRPKLTFSNAQETCEFTLGNSLLAARGTHTFTFNPGDPVNSSGGAIIAATRPAKNGSTYTVKFTYSDALGNGPASASVANVTVDTKPPTVVSIPSSFYVEPASSSGTVVSFNLAATDDQGPVTITATPPSGSLFPLGRTPVQVVFRDAAGNETRGNFTVTVEQSYPPVITRAVPPQTLFAGTDGHAVLPDYTSLLGATDSASAITKTQTPPPGTDLPLGTYALRFVVRNARGRITTSDSSVTVKFARPLAPLVSLIAFTGSEAPGAGEFGGPPAFSVITYMSTPAVDDYRNLIATIGIRSAIDFSSFNSGILLQSGTGVPSLVALTGTPAPGVDPALFDSFSNPVIAPGNRLVGSESTGSPTYPSVAFVASAYDRSAPAVYNGAWTDAFSDHLELVLREGKTAPGLPAGVLVKAITSLSLRDGELLALVELSGTATALDDRALLRMTSANTATVLLRKGAPLFGSTIASISALQPALASEGQGRWHAADGVVAKAALTDGRAFIVKLAPDGTATPLLRAGEAEPALNGAKIASLGLPALAGNSVAIQAKLALAPAGSPQPVGQVTVASDDSILYRNLASGAVRLVREGSAPYNTFAAVFGAFYNPVVNDQDTLLFYSTLRGAGVTAANQGALCTLRASEILPRILARHGSLAVDKAGAPLANTVWNGFVSTALPDGPGAGPVFIARVSGSAVTKATELGVWGVDSAGKLRLLVRTGEQVPAGATFKIISKLTLLDSLPGSFGARRSYNATGSLAVLANFTDGTQALLRIDIP